MTGAVLAVFLVVYLGMFLGGFPGLALDRTGVALLGAIALVVMGAVGPEEARAAIDVPTISLLFSLMVVSAQLRLGGFYARVTERLATARLGAPALLALLCAAVGVLSAVLANDVVCLATAPVLVEGTARRALDPVPFLLGLAASANVGSAATLIGNPQNMLVGQTLRLSFGAYFLDALVPAVAGLVVVWGVLVFLYRGRWRRPTEVATVERPPFDAWQTAKGLSLAVTLVVVFVTLPWPREIPALAVAGLLLLSRKMASRRVLALVDWQLLVLFAGLFVVNHALSATGVVKEALHATAAAGVPLASPPVLFGAVVVLSNLVSNVPAVMLLLPAATHPDAGAVLALASTLAGNLLLVGSIANLIVAEQAARLGVRLGWRTHARAGVPITLLTLALAALWLALR